MKKILLIVLLLATGLSTFAKHKYKKKKATSRDIISATMERTMCFGRCPNYMIEIDNNGMAIYTAIRFNADSGVFKKDIGAAKAMEVLNQFKTYRVDTCKDLYENRIQDVPGIIFTIKYKDGAMKTIRNAHFGPPFLKQLATIMDQAGKKTDDSWKQ